jgi:cytochrome c5
MTRYGLMLVLLCSLLVASCGGSTNVPATAVPPAATEVEATAVPATEAAPTAAEPTPTTAPRAVPATPSGGSTKVDLDKIFPPGPGKDLVMRDCTTCHTFVPIVILQMDAAMWERNGRDHRSRVIGASDEEFRTLYAYLTENFGPDDPVPELPAQLLATWTSY